MSRDMDQSSDYLRLIAMDSEDLSIVSTHMQNAVVRIGEMVYVQHEQRFVVMASRYDWMAARHHEPMRVRAGLHFDHVTRVTHIGVDQSAPLMTLNLQSVLFKPSPEPQSSCEGHILLVFHSGAMIRMDVECIEAQMRDIGPRWPSAHPPEAGVDDRPPYID
jgi:Protein of unknown function (DUF2948)